MSDNLAVTIPLVSLVVKKSVVLIELICVSDYAAQVLFDDIREKMTSDRGFKLELKACAVPSGGAPA